MKEKYGFVYIWYDRKRKMFYIGCHWGNELDNYICSSNRMRDAYRRRPHDFKRRIISRIYTSRHDLLIEEYRWILMIPNDELGKSYYNITKKQFGHWTSDIKKIKNIKNKISKKISNHMQSLTPEDRSKIYGRCRKKTKEEKDKISKSIKKLIENGYKPTPGMKGKSQSEYQKMMVRKARLGKKHSEITKQKMRDAKRQKYGD